MDAVWTLQDAKNRFSAVVDAAVGAGCGGGARLGELCAAIDHDSADLLIAATALERGLKVVTHNLRHFAPTGVQTVNPWMQDPAP